jgi:hypothetical protein
MIPEYILRACPFCGREQRVAVDECGATLPTKRCAMPGCQRDLCDGCDKFKCDGCDKEFCTTHMVPYEGFVSCPQCTLEREPACNCWPIDVDMDDASQCEEHNPASPYWSARKLAKDYIAEMETASMAEAAYVET